MKASKARLDKKSKPVQALASLVVSDLAELFIG
jgi:hypothetical protein